MAQNYVLLERIELNDTAATVTFSNIPQSGYTDLKAVVSARGTDATWGILSLKFNGSATGYSFRQLYATGSAAGSNTGNNETGAGNVDLSSYTASTYSNVEVYIPNYTSSNYKSYSVDSVSENNATAADSKLAANLWSNTAAITSLTFGQYAGSFVSGTTFSLYGIANSNTTPTKAPKATGGNVIATDGTYWYHAFLSNGTFTPATTLSCDVLVVAGGGGGGDSLGGGGGAGGFRTGTGLSISATSYAVTVGAGGAGSVSQTVKGFNGSDSIFSTITSTGGGGGGSNGTTGAAGGSGGGGSRATGTPAASGNTPSTSPSQGNNGGVASGNQGAGGGGAGAVGGNNSGSLGGVGGAGVNTYSSWATATGTGVSGYYAGGGGGASYPSTTGVAGGAGGGGNGAYTDGGSVFVLPTAGKNNTGGGGGGGKNDSVNETGANGGSGIVIVRYTVA